MEATSLTSTVLNQRSKLFKIVCGLLGRQPKERDDITTGLVSTVGQPFRVTVQHKGGRDGGAVFLEAVEVARA